MMDRLDDAQRSRDALRTDDGFEIQFGRVCSLPRRPIPPAHPSRWICVIDGRVRLPRLYVLLCWLGAHRLARRLIWQVVGYRVR